MSSNNLSISLFVLTLCSIRSPPAERGLAPGSHDDRAALGSIYCLATVFATIMAIMMTSTDTHIHNIDRFLLT